MSSSISTRDGDGRRRDALLVVGMLGGPAAWLVALEANYVLATVRCSSISVPVIHGVILIAAAASVMIGLAAWRAGKRGHARQGDASAQRARWMGAGGLGLSVWFAIAILAMEWPVAAVARCGS